MNDSSIRLVRKRFKCLKCQGYESKLVCPNKTRNPCSNCQGFLSEVSEKEYQLQKHNVKTSEIKTTKSFPVKPTREHYKDHYESNKQESNPRYSNKDLAQMNNWNRPPSNYALKKSENSINNNNDNYFRSSINSLANNKNDSKNDLYQSRGRYQSNDYRSINNNHNRRSNHHLSNNNTNKISSNKPNFFNTNPDNYNSNLNEYESNYRPRQNIGVSTYNSFNNNQPNESNGFNINTIFRNIFNQDNIGRGGERRRDMNPNGNGGGASNRTRSVEPSLQIHNPQGVFVIRSIPNYMPVPFGDSFFNNFFGEQQIMSPIIQPQFFSMPFNIRVQRHNFDEADIFDPQFTSFGSTLNGFFLDNFASNFRSNLENEIFEQFINAIQDNLLQAEARKAKKTKKEVLNSLKKFDMTEKYCKKGKNGKLEFPNCCICLSDIGKGENTVLLPCGHMFHWKCCHSWLKDNNTCPVCRFELPAENGDR